MKNTYEENECTAWIELWNVSYHCVVPNDKHTPTRLHQTETGFRWATQGPRDTVDNTRMRYHIAMDESSVVCARCGERKKQRDIRYNKSAGETEYRPFCSDCRRDMRAKKETKVK